MYIRIWVHYQIIVPDIATWELQWFAYCFAQPDFREGYLVVLRRDILGLISAWFQTLDLLLTKYVKLQHNQIVLTKIGCAKQYANHCKCVRKNTHFERLPCVGNFPGAWSVIRLGPCNVDCRHHQALPDWVQPLRFHGQPGEISLDFETKIRVIRPDKIATLCWELLSASLFFCFLEIYVQWVV